MENYGHHLIPDFPAATLQTTTTEDSQNSTDNFIDMNLNTGTDDNNEYLSSLEPIKRRKKTPVFSTEISALQDHDDDNNDTVIQIESAPIVQTTKTSLGYHNAGFDEDASPMLQQRNHFQSAADVDKQINLPFSTKNHLRQTVSQTDYLQNNDPNLIYLSNQMPTQIDQMNGHNNNGHLLTNSSDVVGRKGDNSDNSLTIGEKVAQSQQETIQLEHSAAAVVYAKKPQKSSTNPLLLSASDFTERQDIQRAMASQEMTNRLNQQQLNKSNNNQQAHAHNSNSSVPYSTLDSEIQTANLKEINENKLAGAVSCVPGNYADCTIRSDTLNRSYVPEQRIVNGNGENKRDKWWKWFVYCLCACCPFLLIILLVFLIFYSGWVVISYQKLLLIKKIRS